MKSERETHLNHPGLLVGGVEGEGELVGRWAGDDQEVAAVVPAGVTTSTHPHVRPAHRPPAHTAALALPPETR